MIFEVLPSSKVIITQILTFKEGKYPTLLEKCDIWMDIRWYVVSWLEYVITFDFRLSVCRCVSISINEVSRSWLLTPLLFHTLYVLSFAYVFKFFIYIS